MARKSGNPAKAAQQHSIEQARAAVKQGKQFLVRPFPNTQVLVKSSDPDEAVEVIQALQPAQDVDYDEHLRTMLEQMDGHLAGAMFTQEELVKAWLTNNYEYFVLNKGEFQDWMFDD